MNEPSSSEASVRVAMLELFFDLVLVFTITQVTQPNSRWTARIRQQQVRCVNSSAKRNEMVGGTKPLHQSYLIVCSNLFYLIKAPIYF